MVFDAIAELLAEQLECDKASITPATEFKALGLDSLDVVEMVMKLEDKVGLELELTEKVATVGQLTAFVEARQAERAAQ